MNRVAVSILLAAACACHKHEDAIVRAEPTPTTPIDSSAALSPAPTATVATTAATASASPSAVGSVEVGMIGLLNTGGGADPNAPTAPWGRDDSLGDAGKGNMWGDAIGESFGAGGLGLSGVGAGDGGRGEGIGLGSIGHGSGTGSGQGFGNGHGRLGGAHALNPSRVRQGTTTVNGRLPPEVIQRIVRQNFGRFRLCYENGLRSDPKLAGIVATKFVVDTKGAVSSAARDASTTMTDAGVVSCITRGFTNLSFPQPEGGIVTVIYPLIFEPGDNP